MKQSTPLTSGWTLRLAEGTAPEDLDRLRREAVPAEVPGCVHVDLMAAGLIDDPYLDRNELDVAWVGRADWRYETELPATPGGFERTDLVFEGLDTVATVVLDGTELGTTRNMHRSYRFDVTGLGDGGDSGGRDSGGDGGGRDGNGGGGGRVLSVLFTSAYTEAEKVREVVGARPNAYPEPFNYIRKMASSFGWDWGPTLVTAGIWRPVRLESWSTARLAGVRPLVTVTDANGRVEAHVDLERTATGAARGLVVTVEVAGRAARAEIEPGQVHAVVVLEVPGPERWWPRGYGDQRLYACRVTLADAGTGAELDRWERRIGFRAVALEYAPDEHGTSFVLVVNGEPVFARGVNWIPDDALPARVTPERYRHRLTQARDAGVNLVRVWGGGIYEDRAFYETCDELGLLVWQDFLFACAAYPEERPLRGEVEAEARENVARLTPHPSLVLWNGNNENLWGFRDWRWEEELAGDSWGEGYYLGLLPRVVAELDPTRPYSAGSPWSGSWDHHPNDPAHGPSHFWEVWNRRDYTDYLNDVPRFAAEFGWQAPPAYATLRDAVTDEPLGPRSPGMLHHQKAEDGNGKLDRGLAHHFGAPATFDDWHYLTQVNQARAVATGVAHWRSYWPICAGTVVWQLNDCWPVTSWAAIDGAGRPKPLYHELRRLYADRLVSFQVRDGERVLVVDNQSAEQWDGFAGARRTSADGTVLAEETLPFTVPPRSVAALPLSAEVVTFEDGYRELLVADVEGLRDVVLGCEDRDFAYPEADLAIEVEPRADGFDLVITARAFVRDLLFQADRVAPGARADRGLVTLLPGERCVVGVTGARASEVDLASVRAALFTVNAAQAPARGVARGGARVAEEAARP